MFPRMAAIAAVCLVFGCSRVPETPESALPATDQAKKCDGLASILPVMEVPTSWNDNLSMAKAALQAKFRSLGTCYENQSAREEAMKTAVGRTVLAEGVFDESSIRYGIILRPDGQAKFRVLQEAAKQASRAGYDCWFIECRGSDRGGPPRYIRSGFVNPWDQEGVSFSLRLPPAKGKTGYRLQFLHVGPFFSDSPVDDEIDEPPTIDIDLWRPEGSEPAPAPPASPSVPPPAPTPSPATEPAEKTPPAEKEPGDPVAYAELSQVTRAMAETLRRHGTEGFVIFDLPPDATVQQFVDMLNAAWKGGCRWSTMLRPDD